MVLLRYAARGIRSCAIVRPAAIIATPATTLAGRHCLLQQQQQHRLSSTDSSPPDSPSDSPPSISTINSHRAFVPKTTGPPPYDIPVLEPPWQVSNLSMEEQKAYAKHGPNYVDHFRAWRRESAFRSARRREYIAELYNKDIGPDWYEIYEEAAKRRMQLQTVKDAARDLQQLYDLDIALKKSAAEISTDEALLHKERIDKIQSIRRQRKEISDKRNDIIASKNFMGKKIVGEVLAERGRPVPDWCLSSEDVPEKNNEQ